MAKVIPIVRIVDDDETFCMSQKMFLQAMGWFVLIYNSAKPFLDLRTTIPRSRAASFSTCACPR